MIYLHPPDCACAECSLVLAHECSDAFCAVLDDLVDEWGGGLFAWPGDLVERLVWAACGERGEC